MNQIMKVINNFNRPIKTNFAQCDLEFFVRILLKLSKLKNGRVITINALDLVANLENSDEILKNVLDTIMSFQCHAVDENKKERYTFVCFEAVCFEHKTNTLKITTQRDFYNLVTNYQSNFTNLEIIKFVEEVDKKK